MTGFRTANWLRMYQHMKILIYLPTVVGKSMETREMKRMLIGNLWYKVTTQNVFSTL